MDNLQGIIQTPQDYLKAASPDEIRELKTRLLFQYLRDLLDLNKQLRTFEIAEEISKLHQEHDQALHQVLIKEHRKPH